jgi:hypothetical protein
MVGAMATMAALAEIHGAAAVVIGIDSTLL